MEILIHIIALVGLVFATITDLKSREVPDFLNFSLIAIGVMFGGVASVISMSIWPILASLTGLGAGYLIGAFMFYTGQWGGGDAKMLMALGALLGINIHSLIGNFHVPFFITTVISIFLLGAVYGVFYCVYIVIKHWKSFITEYRQQMREAGKKKIRKIMIIIMALGITLSMTLVQNYVFKILILVVLFIMYMGVHLIFVIKIIEQKCMIKTMLVKNITPGEWMAEDVKFGEKIICSKKDLGITDEQIKELKKHKIKTVQVREGVPFIPGFLLGYLLVVIYGNWIIYFF